METEFERDWCKIKERLNWDFNVKKEFFDRKLRTQAGFAFVIDVWDGEVNVMLYRIAMNGSETLDIEKQPPAEMIEKALEEQGGSCKKNGLYNITPEIKAWLETNIIK